MAALLASVACNLWIIRRYTPLVASEVAWRGDVGDGSSPDCFTALGFNVYQYNRDHAKTLAMLEREQPDLLLLMETDDAWARALDPALASYPYRTSRPLENTYGMIFASRLRVDTSRLEMNTVADTPTLYAVVTTRGGAAFDYVGLHPRPPRPGRTTGLRDANIETAARHTTGDSRSALVMGDFNDVPWSRTTQHFKQIGQFLDPRVGHGLFASFPARKLWIGLPLDHAFLTERFVVRRVELLADVGSDHRPLAVSLCLPAVHAGQR